MSVKKRKKKKKKKKFLSQEHWIHLCLASDSGYQSHLWPEHSQANTNSQKTEERFTHDLFLRLKCFEVKYNPNQYITFKKNLFWKKLILSTVYSFMVINFWRIYHYNMILLLSRSLWLKYKYNEIILNNGHF